MFGVYWNTMEKRICDVWDEKEWWRYFSKEYLIPSPRDATMWSARWYYGLRRMFSDTCAQMNDGDGGDSRKQDEVTPPTLWACERGYSVEVVVVVVVAAPPFPWALLTKRSIQTPPAGPKEVPGGPKRRPRSPEEPRRGPREPRGHPQETPRRQINDVP